MWTVGFIIDAPQTANLTLLCQTASMKKHLRFEGEISLVKQNGVSTPISPETQASIVVTVYSA